MLTKKTPDPSFIEQLPEDIKFYLNPLNLEPALNLLESFSEYQTGQE
jgi:hypothetical protein